jgi:peptide/nickel transport system substrate-binding protein
MDVPGKQHYTFHMQTDVSPYDSNDVRLALKYAVDREELRSKILLGYGTIGNDHPIGPAYQFYANELEQRTYDPDKAKFHLKKANLTTLTVSLSAANAAFDGALDAAALFREQAAKSGITVDIVREAEDAFWENVWLKRPFCMSYWLGRPTADQVLTTVYAADAEWNETRWKNRRFNELLVQARGELDNSKRRAMYADMQSLIRDEGGAIIPLFANYVMAKNKRLGTEQISGAYDLDGFKAAERWWFAA